MKKITKLTSLILTLALILGLTSSLTACKPIEEVTKSSFNITMPDANNLSVKLMSSEVSVTNEGYLTKTLTATVSPATQYNQAVNWSVEWKNANSTWATGKSVSDYVEVVPKSEGSLTATVTCKQAFGEKINVIVTSQMDNTKTATCVCDYKKRLLGFEDVKIGNSELINGSFRLVKTYSQNHDLTLNSVFSDYTYEIGNGTASDFHAYLYLYQDFEDKLADIGVNLDHTQIYMGGDSFIEDANSIHKNQDNVVYVNSYNLFYSGNFLYGLLDTTDRISFNLGNHSKLNNLFNSLGTEYDIGFIRVNYAYGSYDEYVDYPIYLDESVVNLAVSNVALASNNIIF